jgi:20S proteasome alpha/beta subunit
MREFLEKNYKETSGKETIKLAIRVLLEDSSSSTPFRQQVPRARY